MNVRDYVACDGIGLAGLIRRGEVSAAEVQRAASERIDAVNPYVNAVIRRMDPAAQPVSDPRAPFAGVPFLIKDLVATCAGVPMASGSRFLRDFVPDHDSEMVRRYRRAGLVFFGKTNTPEFGLTPVTEPEAFGITRNPWDLARTVGGSSGGAAAAVASGMVPIAGGGDGGGSIRIPASCCGLFGLKPSRGRNPLGPDRGELWSGAVVEHVLTRSVRDSAAVLDAVAGPDPGAPFIIAPPGRPFLAETTDERPQRRLRIGWTTHPLLGGTVHPECVRGVQEAVRLLQEFGHEVVEDTPPFDGRTFCRAFLTMICGELRSELREAERMIRRRAGPADLEVTTWALALLGDRASAARFAEAMRELRAAGRILAPYFERYDMMLTPTLATPPVPHGTLQPPAHELLLMKWSGRLRAGWLLMTLHALERAADTVFAFTPWTPIFNMTGQPAMSVPLHWAPDGLPVGIHVVARFGDESGLLRLAAQLERARPWAHRMPPEPSSAQPPG